MSYPFKVLLLTQKNIRTILDWPVPGNVVDIRSFMGLAIFYCCFIGGFSRIAYPVTFVQKKGIMFKWAVECQHNFEQLKQLLTSTPMLKVVELEKEFIICTYACQEGVGGFFMRDGKVVACE